MLEKGIFAKKDGTTQGGHFHCGCVDATIVLCVHKIPEISGRVYGFQLSMRGRNLTGEVFPSWKYIERVPVML